MLILGLTGPTGAGKTLFSEILKGYGYPTLNADELYHSLLVPPSHALDAIRAEFGDGFFFENGELNRKKLGSHVFSSPAELEKLNSTVLPIVIASAEKIAEEYRNNGVSMLIIDAPTLFESGYDKACELTVSILAPAKIRAERISRRDGISKSDALLRINAQKSDEFYISRSDKIIINDGSESLEAKARELLCELGLCGGEKNE